MYFGVKRKMVTPLVGPPKIWNVPNWAAAGAAVPVGGAGDPRCRHSLYRRIDDQLFPRLDICACVLRLRGAVTACAVRSARKFQVGRPSVARWRPCGRLLDSGRQAGGSLRDSFFDGRSWLNLRRAIRPGAALFTITTLPALVWLPHLQPQFNLSLATEPNGGL